MEEQNSVASMTSEPVQGADDLVSTNSAEINYALDSMMNDNGFDPSIDPNSTIPQTKFGL